MKIGPSWPEGGMRKWEVIVSRALSNTASRVLDCVCLSRNGIVHVSQMWLIGRVERTAYSLNSMDYLQGNCLFSVQLWLR